MGCDRNHRKLEGVARMMPSRDRVQMSSPPERLTAAIALKPASARISPPDPESGTR